MPHDSNSDVIWLGQCSASPFQHDSTVPLAYVYNSTKREWPTFYQSKAHRLHDIRSLCTNCSKININDLRDGKEFRLQEDYHDIVESASECRFCSLIAQKARHSLQYRPSSEFPTCFDRQDIPRDRRVPLFLRWDRGKIRVFARQDGLPLYKVCSLELSSNDGPTGSDTSRKVDLSLTLGQTDDFSLSAASFAFTTLKSEIRRILDLQSCGVCAPKESGPIDQRAQEYGAVPPSPLPDRVLQIVASPTSSEIECLRLVQTTQNQKGRYVALSHRWGGNITLKTTKDTLPSRLRGFRFEDLPKTFQDAVLIANTLDIENIWIDSLCIVQDDQEDWIEQAKKMGSVYLNATFTIAAHSAGQCNEGFLWRSQIPDVLHIAPTHGGPDFNIKLNEIYQTILRDRLLDSEISRRGWVLQELTLSPRILHFIENRLIWECSHKQPKVGKSQVETTANMFRWESKDRGHAAWLNMASRYSSYGLTKMSDKLVAIDGIAEEWKRKTERDHDKLYHCGIFEADIERSLLWCTSTSSETHYARAPSWSWASVDSEVHFLPFDSSVLPSLVVIESIVHGRQGTTKNSALKISYFRPHDSHGDQPGISRCEIAMKAATINPKRGVLELMQSKEVPIALTGLSDYVFVLYEDRQPIPMQTWARQSLSSDRVWYAWFSFSDHTEYIRMMEDRISTLDLVFLVIRGHQVKGRLAGAWCLIVRPVEGEESVFRRVGFGYLRDMEALESALKSPHSIVLV